MPTATKSMEQTCAVRVELAITIAANKKRVWKALVEETPKWWLMDACMGGDKAKKFIIEQKLGGKVYEDFGNGEGMLWYTVTGIHAPHELHLVGHWPPTDCADMGPVSGMLKLSLEEKGASTVLHVQDNLVGRIGESAGASVEDGWRQIFTNGLKRFVESGKRN